MRRPENDETASTRSADPASAGDPAPRGAETPSEDDDDEVPSGLKRFFGGSWKETSRYADAAYGLVGGLLGLGLLGWLADRFFGTSPRCLLVGLLLGGGVGFYRLGRAMLFPP